MKNRHHRGALALLLPIALLASGCLATKSYVGTELESSETRISERLGGIETLIEENQEALAEQGTEIDRIAEETAELSRTTQEALDRAIEAGKLAEGKFLYETVLSDDSVLFGFDEATLGPEAREALDAFGEELRARNEGVYIEIQGHTDAIGSETYNLELGQRRADSVLRYLNREHGFPLHRMSAISYGESAPLVENDSRENRARNRRVALVVLK